MGWGGRGNDGCGSGMRIVMGPCLRGDDEEGGRNFRAVTGAEEQTVGCKAEKQPGRNRPLANLTDRQVQATAASSSLRYKGSADLCTLEQHP